MPSQAVNKGPTGGSYRNKYNHLTSGGETHPTEPMSGTGETMAYMPVEEAAQRGEQRQATEKEIKGGN